MADESLVTLTAPQFENLMETQGLNKTTKGIVDIAAEELGVDSGLTYKGLRDGSWPGFDGMKRYKNLSPEQRSISDEEILTLFTNVDDHGKYDPEEGTYSGLKAGTYSAARMLPETIGGGYGFTKGLAFAAPLAAMVPPIGIPGLLIRGGIYVAGGLGGMMMGAIAAGEAEDLILGEKAPVVPSLQPSANAGESGMIALSLLGSPAQLNPTKIKKVGSGALQFLDSFKNVSSGKFAEVADEAFKLTAKNAGLSNSAFAKANAAREAATAGPAFGGPLGVNLGLTRFNPAGYLFDPRKGPAAARAIAGVESGIGRSMSAAREKYGRFLGIEALSAAGGGLGAYVAQDTNPYNERVRFWSEFAGSALVPMPIQLLTDVAPDIPSVVKRWWGKSQDIKGPEGLLTGKLKTDGVKRIMAAIKKSEQYKDTRDDAGNLIEAADEKFAKFIDGIIENSVDADGNIVSFTTADLAKTAGLPFSETIATIQNELQKSSKDLATATGRGREEMQAGAVNAIRTLVATGDPVALAAAARVQQSLFEQNIVDNLDTSITKLYDAAGKLVGGDAAGGSRRVDLSQKLYDVLSNQIKLSKVRERKIWGQVGSFPITQFISPNGKVIDQPNILQLLDRPSNKNGLKFSLKGSQGDFDASLGKYKDDLDDFRTYFQDGSGRNPFTADKVFTMRSALLSKASALKKNGDLIGAERLNKVNDALLRDLTGQADGASAPYNAARAYTFARNNVFTRTFLNKLQVTTKERGLVLSPSTLLDDAFTGSNSQVANRFKQIRAAGTFLVDEAGFTPEQVKMMDTETIITEALQDSLRKVVDEKTVKNPAKPGETITTFVVNPNKLATFNKAPGTKELYSLLPDLQKDFATVASAKNAFDNIVLDASDQMSPSRARKLGFSEEQLTQMYDTKAFQHVLEFEDPGEAVAKALADPKPTMALRSLARMAKNTNLSTTEYTNEQALTGLKTAIINEALTEAKTSSGSFSGDILQRKLFGQLEGSDPTIPFSMDEFLVRQNMMDQGEVDELQKAIKTLRGVEEAFATGDIENVLFKNPSLAKLFYVRIAGATAGGQVQKKMMQMLGLPPMSGGLVAEQTGSEVVQKLLLKGPEAQTIKIMAELFANPNALGIAMRELKNKSDADAAMNALEKVLAPLFRQVGRRVPYGVREELEEEYVAPEVEPVIAPVVPPAIPVRPDNSQQGSLMPIGAPTPIGPAPLSIQQASAAPGPTLQNSGPVDRERYAALFPNDSTTQLMNSGIGSLA